MMFGWLDVELIEVSSKRVFLQLTESTGISQHPAAIPEKPSGGIRKKGKFWPTSSARSP
jgi:hypothetical protein